MLFRVLIEKDPKNIAVVRVRPTALQFPGIYITDGNAASGPTSFYDLKEGRKTISKNWRTINANGGILWMGRSGK